MVLHARVEYASRGSFLTSNMLRLLTFEQIILFSFLPNDILTRIYAVSLNPRAKHTHLAGKLLRVGVHSLAFSSSIMLLVSVLLDSSSRYLPMIALATFRGSLLLPSLALLRLSMQEGVKPNVSRKPFCFWIVLETLLFALSFLSFIDSLTSHDYILVSTLTSSPRVLGLNA